MRKYRKLALILICIILTFLIFSCTRNKDDINSGLESGDISEGVQEEKIFKTMEEFDDLVNKKGVKLEEIIGFVDKNIETVGSENGDILIYTLEEKLESQINKRLASVLSKDTDKEIETILKDKRLLDEEGLESVKNELLKEEIESLLNLKYVLYDEEEKIDLVIDYTKLLGYDDFATQEVKDYLNIRSKLLDTPTIYNGDFNISIEDLGGRLLRYENYIVEYPKSKRYETLLGFYRIDLINYLKGSKTEPVWSQEKGVNTKVLASYRNLTKNKNSITSSVVRKYLSILNESGFKSQGDLEVKILSLVNEAIGTIEDKVE